jgi:hypothetical protein
VPRGAVPFSKEAWYGRNEPIFSDEFRSDFATEFERAGSSEFFDFYEAKAGAAALE